MPAPTEHWLRLARTGDLVTAYRSRDGRFWTVIDQRQVALSPIPLVGLAAATVANAAVGSVTFDRVRVLAGTPERTLFPETLDPNEGIIFRDGGILAGRLVALDASAAKLSREKGKDHVIPTQQIARLLFNRPPPNLAQLPATAKPGLLLLSGEYVEGETLSLSDAQLKFRLAQGGGERTYRPADDLIAAILAPAAEPTGAFRLRTRDGSLYLARAMTLLKDSAVVEDRYLSWTRLPAPDLLELRTEK